MAAEPLGPDMESLIDLIATHAPNLGRRIAAKLAVMAYSDAIDADEADDLVLLHRELVGRIAHQAASSSNLEPAGSRFRSCSRVRFPGCASAIRDA